MENKQTMGVKTLLGNPKKAIIKLSIPMIIAMSIQIVYQLADTIWVSGIGPEALTAMGLFFPFFLIMIGLGTGLGIGGGSAISRFIGAKNKEAANSVAAHTIILVFIISIVFTPIILFCSKYLFIIMGADKALDKTLAYSNIIFSASLLFFFGNVANALLRAEGDAKRVMLVMVVGAILNIIFDPFFIYQKEFLIAGVFRITFGLNMGVRGAALATVLSFCFSCIVLFYWLFIKKNTYISITFKKFKFKKDFLFDISRIGFPSILSHISMSVLLFIVNFVNSYVAGEDGVAIFITGWRIVMIAILPLLAISTAVTSVIGAAYGAGEIKKMRTAFLYAIKMGIIIEIIIAFFTFFFASEITKIFTWSKDTMRLRSGIINMIQIIWIFYPAVSGSMLSSAFFQGVGKGKNSLIITFIRTIIICSPLVVLFSIVFKMGLNGVYIGMITATWFSTFFAFGWSMLFIKGLEKGKKQEIKND